MAKHLKIQIKKEQIAKAIKLGGLQDKLAPKKKEEKDQKKKLPAKKPVSKAREKEETAPPVEGEEAVRRTRARSKSAFSKEEEDEAASPAESEEEKQESFASPAPAEEATLLPHPSEPPTTSEEQSPPPPQKAPKEHLGPTGRHIKDLLPPKKEKANLKEPARPEKEAPPQPKERVASEEELEGKKKGKAARFKEFRDLKPTKKGDSTRQFDARDRQGLRRGEEEDSTKWRKKRASREMARFAEELPVRPTALTIRLPISIRELAGEMKLKASELIGKLFLQGIVMTLNDLLDDETTVQILGEEFGCMIAIDTSEQQRIRITDKTVKEEIEAADSGKLAYRPPIIAFMGHVDHGKTSLIDAIRETNVVSGEAGDITQHIGAFLTKTPVGPIAILDTPGHEAFSAMRARGADVTDIVVLVVAGDEGLRQQTLEAIQHARAANVQIVVAINKSDKANFNAQNVYRQLSENELLPEAWGGQTITVNCSAVTKEGIDSLLEMLALQAEVLELKADPLNRARGRVLESKMQKGLGAAATLLVQNGTLRQGDAVVFDTLWGRVKTMKDEFNRDLQEAGPSTPVEISGLSGLPEAGQEFIVVASEKEARDIAKVRMEQSKQKSLQQLRKPSIENLFQQAAGSEKKILNLVLRADVQGSLEALKNALLKIESEKINLEIIFTGIGEISEADVQLAAASKAMVLGFHTQIERHAETLVKELGVQVRTHDIIYHAVDDVRAIMTNLLDKIAEEETRGKAEVRATFKSSHFGVIAGCYVLEGTIHRNHQLRLIREEKCIWKGGMSSLRRVKEDVREVQKGVECGIVLSGGMQDVQEGDILESFDIVYHTQEL